MPRNNNQRNKPRYQKSAAPAAGGGSCKKRARALQRLLRRDTLPAAVRKQKEAELASLQTEAESHSLKHKRTERERHFSKKYHKVKFFERRKVERRLQLLRRKQDDEPGSSEAELADAIREAEHNLLCAAPLAFCPSAVPLTRASLSGRYIKHYPRHKKYLALFPKENAEDSFVAKRRARIRAAIIRRAEAGTLGRPTDEDDDDEAAAAAEGTPALDDDFFERQQGGFASWGRTGHAGTEGAFL